MPKTKQSVASRCKSLESEFTRELISTEGKIVQHINTAKHKELVAKKRDRSEGVESLLVECMGNKLITFSYDLCEPFLAADISLWKINNSILRSIISLIKVLNGYSEEQMLQDLEREDLIESSDGSDADFDCIEDQ
ncbi:hypothetical protein C0J52_18496 [Blattella germanica]|nr:hypothetical protein C0J52_18496 [Blattella germanica]